MEHKDTTEHMDVTTDTNAVKVVDKDARHLVEMQKRSGVISKLFNKKQHEEYQEHELGIIKTELTYQQKALESTRDGQLHLIQENINTFVSTERTRLLTEREKMIDQIRTDRELQVNEETKKFIDQWEKEYAQAEQIKNEIAKKFQLDRLNKQIAEYFKASDYFSEKYKQAITYES